MIDGWTAVLLAGQRPGDNGFAEANGVAAKALIPVAGEPMLGRVVRTLLALPALERIVILAQRPDELLGGELGWIKAETRVATAIAGQGISSSIDALIDGPSPPFPLLVVTADHPLLTPAMVEAFIADSDGVDVAFAIVDRRTVEAAYPETRRTWLRFSDGDYTGANLFALRTPASRKALEIWSNIEQDRKKALRLLTFFGPMLALRALTRTISFDRALTRIGARIGTRVRAVRLPFADAAVDVDKQSDLELVEHILTRRDN